MLESRFERVGLKIISCLQYLLVSWYAASRTEYMITKILQYLQHQSIVELIPTSSGNIQFIIKEASDGWSADSTNAFSKTTNWAHLSTHTKCI